VPLISIFQIAKDGWAGITGFKADRESYIAGAREGTLAWRRAK